MKYVSVSTVVFALFATVFSPASGSCSVNQPATCVGLTSDSIPLGGDISVVVTIRNTLDEDIAILEPEVSYSGYASQCGDSAIKQRRTFTLVPGDVKFWSIPVLSGASGFYEGDIGDHVVDVSYSVLDPGAHPMKEIDQVDRRLVLTITKTPPVLLEMLADFTEEVPVCSLSGERRIGKRLDIAGFQQRLKREIINGEGEGRNGHADKSYASTELLEDDRFRGWSQILGEMGAYSGFDYESSIEEVSAFVDRRYPIDESYFEEKYIIWSQFFLEVTDRDCYRIERSFRVFVDKDGPAALSYLENLPRGSMNCSDLQYLEELMKVFSRRP